MLDSNKSAAVLLADILNFTTILICTVSKLPQLFAIIKGRSSRGISLLSVSLEVLRMAILWCYNYCFGYPLMTYLEHPVLLAQQFILVYLVIKFNAEFGAGSKALSLFAAVFLIISMSLLFVGTLPREILSFLIPLCTPLSGFSKLIQFAKIVQTKDSTAVSLTTWFLTVFSSFSRIYIVIMDSGDKMLIANSTTSFVTGLSVYLAAIYYKKPHKSWAMIRRGFCGDQPESNELNERGRSSSQTNWFIVSVGSSSNTNDSIEERRRDKFSFFF